MAKTHARKLQNRNLSRFGYSVTELQIDRYFPEKIRDDSGNVTDGRMLKFFLKDTKGKRFLAKKLMGLRNWCTIEMSTIDNSLFFELYVEMFLGAGKSVKYNIVVPPLLTEE